MSVTKPTFYPKIANLSALVESTIPSGIRSVGYSAGTALPSAQFNELANEVSKWIQWMDQEFNYVTLTGTFNAVFPTSKTLVITYWKYTDGTVKLSWPALASLDSSSSHNASGYPVPAAITPSTTHVIPIGINSTATPGFLSLVADRSLQIVAYDGNPFTGLTPNAVFYKP